jgi:acetyl-CoA synthetase
MKKLMPASKGRSLSTVQVALRVMGFMTAHPEGVEASAVAGWLGKSLSSAYSILNSFVQEGVAERVGSAYRFVALLPGLGSDPRMQAMSFESDLHLALEKLYAKTHERVYLALWSEGCLKVVSRGRQGQPKPAGAEGNLTRGFHALAMGKAVLAWLPETVLKAQTLQAFTPFTLTDFEVLQAEFEWIRQHGIAVQLEEFSLGFSGVAAPIFGEHGEVIGAFGAVMTSKRFAAAFVRLTTALREVAFASSILPAKNLYTQDAPKLEPSIQSKNRPLQKTSASEWASKEVQASANLQDYKLEHFRSLQDSDGFWNEWATRFHWFKNWQQTLDWQFPEHHWFVGGQTNICFNALDRHVLGSKRNQLAIIALSGDGTVHKLCYRELLDRVARLANAFKALGLKPGDRLATYLPTGLEAALCMLACARIGVIHVVIPAGLGAQTLKERLEHSGAAVLVAADRVFQRGRVVSLTANVEEATSGLNLRIVWHCRGELKSDLEFWDLLEASTPDSAALKLESEHPLFIIYTGSGDKSRGVIHSHAGIMVGASYQLRSLFDAKDTDVIWCTGDLSWIFGHVYGLYAPLLEGLTTILREEKLDYPDPNNFYTTLEQHGVNVLLTSPTWLGLLSDHGLEALAGKNISNLHLVVSGGAVLTSDVWHWTRDHLLAGGQNGFVIDHWWQTETGAPVLGTPLVMPFKMGQVGVSLPGIDAAVVDLTGLEVPAGTVGQLVLRRPFPHLLKGLWNDPTGFLALWDANTKAYLSGDLAVMDFEGYIGLRGRVDDAIKAGDYLIAASEIEQVLTSNPNVLEAAVIKLGDNEQDNLKHSNLEHGSTLKIFVVFTDTNATHEIESVLKQRLQAQLQNHFGPTLGASEILILERLPRSKGGSVLRHELRNATSPQSQEQG